MKILIVGGGGREHALAWTIASSARVTEVLVAPGNAGTALEPKIRNVAVAAEDVDGLLELACTEQVAMAVIGPEAPLVAGIVDRFSAREIPCFGPTAAAARLEGSKAYAKEFMSRHGIPTAGYGRFDDITAARAFVHEQGVPIVIKADGLAAGKGVVIAHSLAEAEQALEKMMQEGAFGDAGREVVVEAFLEGEEASFIVLASGTDFVCFPTSQDHKRVGQGDSGPNTGGMGAYSPAPVVTEAVRQRAIEQVIRPALAGLAAEGAPYIGFLYAGLMINQQGEIQVLEFNCRLGDPETQPLLLRLRSDLVTLIELALERRLAAAEAHWDERPSLGVVLAADGYPGRYPRGMVVHGLRNVEDDDVKIFHAGTQLDEQQQVITSGGRVFVVCALGEDLQAARDHAYQAAAQVRFKHCYLRDDIGFRALSGQD